MENRFDNHEDHDNTIVLNLNQFKSDRLCITSTDLSDLHRQY